MRSSCPNRQAPGNPVPRVPRVRAHSRSPAIRLWVADVPIVSVEDRTWFRRIFAIMPPILPGIDGRVASALGGLPVSTGLIDPKGWINLTGLIALTSRTLPPADRSDQAMETAPDLSGARAPCHARLHGDRSIG